MNIEETHMKPEAYIKDPVFVSVSDGTQRAIGQVSGHPRQDEFKTERQMTSKIVRLIDDNTFETKNTIYHIQHSDEEYPG